MEVRILFADGTEITAQKNGDSYIAEEKFEVNDEQLAEVKITSEEGETVLEDCEIQECASVDGKFWFAIREIPAAVEEAAQLRADVDYLLAITE